MNSFIDAHKRQINAVIQGLSGSAASLAVYSLAFPFHKISTRMQVEESDNYSSTPQAIKSLIQEEGFPSLFSGFGQNWLANAAEQGIYYYWYQRIRDHYGAGETTNNWKNFLISMAAAAITVFFVNPIWVINTRQSTNKSPVTGTLPTIDSEISQGFFPTLKRTITDEGPISLYSGLIPALILAVNPAIHYTAFEKLKARLASYLLQQKGKTPTPDRISQFSFTLTQLFLLGVTSKAIATLLTYPLVVIRSRMQVTKQGFFESIKQAYQEGGLSSFFKGIDAKILFSLLNAGLMMMLQDRIAGILSRFLNNVLLKKKLIKA